MSLLVLAFSLWSALSAHSFTVKEFHPEGLVKLPRQARAVFSEPMVPFGDPRGLEPFTVACSQKGKGLWEDSRTWSYEFAQELGAGERCSFQAKAGLKSAKGSAWEGKTNFMFSTGGPSVLSSRPYEGSALEQRPAFLLILDGAVNPVSVEKNAYVLVEGLPERIPLQLLPEKVAQKMANPHQDSYDDGESELGNGKRKQFFVALQSTRTLPAATRIQLVWGKGIQSPQGVATAADQLFAYRTEEEFTAKFSCERENADAPCLPIGDLSVSFTAPISRNLAEQVELRGEKLSLKPSLGGKEEFLSYLRFKGPFPPNTKFAVHLPRNLKDETGRDLRNADKFPLAAKTGGYPPLAKFAAPFGILEAQDPVLPVTLRNVEEKMAGITVVGSKIALTADNPKELVAWVQRLFHKHNNYFRYENEKSFDTRGDALLAGNPARQKFALPKPNGAESFEVVGIPLGKKGFHIVELESRLLGKSLLGKPAPMYVAAGALVTNLGVHFKWGVENSLVWVTSLDKGRPVKGARIRLADCNGKVLWEGKTSSDGAVLAEKIPTAKSVTRCKDIEDYRYASGLTVIAEKDGDFSFSHTSWDSGIEAWRFHLPYSEEGDDTVAHTILDRALFRAGQTVHMKHILREKFLKGIRYSKEAMPKHLVIQHSSGKRITMPVRFSASGTAETEWKTPNEADLGSYEIYLTAKDVEGKPAGNDSEQAFSPYSDGVYNSGHFRVEEFRLPVMSASLQWPAGPLVGASSVPVDLSVRYLAGGGAAGLEMKIRSRVDQAWSASFPAFDGFTFANGGVKAGKTGRGKKREEDADSKTFPDQKLRLDASGTARATLAGLPAWDVPSRLSVEAEYRDPSGEIHSVGRDFTVFPTLALVGIQPDGWVSQKDKVKFKLAVATPEGKALAGKHVRAEWFSKETFSHRKRIVGGFYSYENYEEVKARGLACEGSTNEKGILLCEGQAPASGNMILVAETADGGRKSRAHHDVWIAQGGDWWFGSENDDRIDLLPEKKAYEPGETARLQVRVPFREATALVTVEREGIIERFVQEIDGKNPVIAVAIHPEYAPNVFVSALVVRGRTGDPQATALVDLAKPAHKLGMAEVWVGWNAHRLKVSVESDRKEYRVRDKAKVKIAVTRALDGKPASKGEVTIAAVDEALLQLLPNNSWKLLDAMMGRRSLRVKTSTAQSQVIGKRHFGLKALPAGGGGGLSPSRELFDSLLYWKATVPLDSKGETEAEVPLNDSLSSFRIVAIANEEADRFGTGETSVRTRQDLMLFSGISPLARWADKTFSEATVRNSSDQELQVTVKGSAGKEQLKPQELVLAAGAAKIVSWPITIPSGVDQIAYQIEASAGETKDSLTVVQKLEPPLRASVLQGSLERLDGTITFPVARPKNSLPDSSALMVKLSRSLASNLLGVRRYMEEYPYGCLEQQVSKAVALRDPALWKKLSGNLSPYIDGAGLLKFFPQAQWGSDALTSYVLQVTQEAGYSLPAHTLSKLVQGLQGFVTGKNYYAGFIYPAADTAIRKLAAMEALSRYQSFDPAYLGTIQLEPELWPMRALVDWFNLLRREQQIPERAKRLAKVEEVIRSRLEWRGTVVGFRGAASPWWLLSSADEEANRLLLAAASEPRWNDDIGRLVRGVLARQKHGSWDLTTANAWGVLALERFSALHEQEAVGGSSLVEVGGQKQSVAWNAEGGGPALQLAFPQEKSMLKVSHQGSGKPWVFFEAKAAVRLAEPVFKGYRVQRSVKPVTQKVRGKWSVGDVYRVTLAIEAPQDMTWVAVSDPIPASATVLGSGLGGDSSLLTKGEKQKGWSAGTFEERSFSGFRAYHEWLPRGSHQVEYTVRLNAAGTFQLPNTRVEAMYAPELYAEVPNGTLSVQP